MAAKQGTKWETALSVLGQSLAGICLCIIAAAGLLATIILSRGWMGDFRAYSNDRPLALREWTIVVANATTSTLSLAISFLSMVLYRHWMQWRLESGVPAFELVAPGEKWAGVAGLLAAWSRGALSRVLPSQAGPRLTPSSAVLFVVLPIVFVDLVLLGNSLNPILLREVKVTAKVTLEATGSGANQDTTLKAVNVPERCNLFDSYTNVGVNGTTSWEPPQRLIADGNALWMRNIFSARSIGIRLGGEGAFKGWKDLLGKVPGAPSKGSYAYEEVLRNVLGGDAYASAARFTPRDALANSVLVAGSRALSGCTASSLMGNKTSSTNSWSVELGGRGGEKTYIGVLASSRNVSGFNATEYERPADGIYAFNDSSCRGCWGRGIQYGDNQKLILILRDDIPGLTSELVVYMKTGRSFELFSLRAALLTINGPVTVAGAGDKVTGALDAANVAGVESNSFTRAFACNVVQAIANNGLELDLGRACSNESRELWYADVSPDPKPFGRSVSRLIKFAARLTPVGNPESAGIDLELPGMLAAVLSFTIKMITTAEDPLGGVAGFGVAPEEVTITLPKLRWRRYAALVASELAVAVGIVCASLWFAARTRYESRPLGPLMFFGRLSIEERQKFAGVEGLTADVAGNTKLDEEWVSSTKLRLTLSEGGRDLELLRCDDVVIRTNG